MLKKLSLAALIAMTSMSVATATPLTEAIKGVDLSGNIKVKFDNSDNDKDESKNKWTVSGDFKFTVPVSEELKVVYKIGAKQEIETKDDGVEEKKTPELKSKLVYLNYSANGLNVVAGKIPVGTSVTDDDAGVGAITTYKVADQLTLAAGWVDHLDVDSIKGNDIYTLAALFNVENMVKGSVWYYHVTNILDHLYTISLDVTPVDFVSLHADYAAGKGEAKGAKTHTYFNVSAGAKFEGASLKVGYAATNDENGAVVLNNDAPISDVLPVKQLKPIANKQDETAIYAKAGYDVADNTNVYLAYATIDDDTANNKDYSEIALGGSYKYTKKMKLSAYYSIKDGKNGAKDDDNNKFGFEAKYSF